MRIIYSRARHGEICYFLPAFRRRVPPVERIRFFGCFRFLRIGGLRRNSSVLRVLRFADLLIPVHEFHFVLSRYGSVMRVIYSRARHGEICYFFSAFRRRVPPVERIRFFGRLRFLRIRGLRCNRSVFHVLRCADLRFSVHEFHVILTFRRFEDKFITCVPRCRNKFFIPFPGICIFRSVFRKRRQRSVEFGNIIFLDFRVQNRCSVFIEKRNFVFRYGIILSFAVTGGKSRQRCRTRQRDTKSR